MMEVGKLSNKLKSNRLTFFDYQCMITLHIITLIPGGGRKNEFDSYSY